MNPGYYGEKLFQPAEGTMKPLPSAAGRKASNSVITLFMCGDVMTGRGIDQVLPHPGDPRLHESYVKDARDYVAIAEAANGPIPRPVGFAWIWGDALPELERAVPDLRLINLETAVTRSDAWEAKGINYRMHPDNLPSLTAAGIDYCSLANNHVLDWGEGGLEETLTALDRAGIRHAGAGRSLVEAKAPAALALPGKGRVLVFSFGAASSGIPPSWAATADRPGVNLLPDLTERTVRRIGEEVHKVRQPGDIVVASLHWGGNWGYEIPREQTEFAHRLIDEAAVDLIHGHSSHHVKGLEVYQGKPVIYGCGDFLNDYEGISGYETYRDDLTLMYFVRMDPETGGLIHLKMIPMQIRNFRLNRAPEADARWLAAVLTREGRKLGTQVELNEDHELTLQW
jgi:poly-gamma-glutamate synthesis protein (capsule biosynthesis protein)